MNPDGDERLTLVIDALVDELNVSRRTRAVAISSDDALLSVLRLQERNEFGDGH